MKSITFTRYFVDEEGHDVEEEVTVPAKNELCWRCKGNGVHDHPAFNNGISAETFAEDPDFAEDYMEGVYDVTCSVCHGEKVIRVADLDRCSPEQLKWWREYQDEQREMRAEERRWGKYQW